MLKRYQTPILVLVALLLPLFVYRASSVRDADANFIDRAVLVATSPLKRLLTFATLTVSDGWHRYVDLLAAREAYGEILRRQRVIERELSTLEHHATENRELRRLLELQAERPELETFAATVIGAGISPAARTLEIDRGLLHGVERGMPVLAGEGLVGLIQRVGWSTAEVLLIADDRVSVRVTVSRTGAQGRISGRGLARGYDLELSEFLRSDDVAKGDRLITNGMGGVFPPGLPVGLVAAVTEDPAAQHRHASVAPFVDFARLTQVLVLSTRRPEPSVVTPEALLPPALRAATATSGVDL